jgi:hypothetical protein
MGIHRSEPRRSPVAACRSATRAMATSAHGLRRTTSSLSLAQSPSKPGTARVPNHRSRWLQLPRASSRQDSAQKIGLRRAGAAAEPGSRSPPPVAGAMGRTGRAGDRWRGHAVPPMRARGPAPRAQLPVCQARQRGAADQPPAAMAARPAGRGQSAVRRSAARQPWRLGAARRQRPQGPAPSPPRRRHRPPARPSPAPWRTTAAARAGPAGPTPDRSCAGRDPQKLSRPPPS